MFEAVKPIEFHPAMLSRLQQLHKFLHCPHLWARARIIVPTKAFVAELRKLVEQAEGLTIT
jgi:hypothetical protein